MPKISTLPVIEELDADDLLLITDREGTRARTRQTTVGAFANYSLGLLPQASASGAGLLSVAFYNDLFNATHLPTPSTLVKRDASGRFRSTTPSNDADVATKEYVDDAVDELDERTIRLFKQTITGNVTSFNIDHNFGTRDVVVQVYDLSSNDTIMVDVVRATTDRVQIGFSSAPGASSYRVLVQG